MNLVRRFVVLCAFSFWQGGLAFYGAIVVPAGQRVLGSHFAQGLITQQVTRSLEVAGFAAVCALVWDSRGSRVRLSMAAVLAMTVGVQVLLHHWMNPMVDVEHARVADGFRVLHRAYLWTAALQWALALSWMAATLREWLAGRELIRAAL